MYTRKIHRALSLSLALLLAAGTVPSALAETGGGHALEKRLCVTYTGSTPDYQTYDPFPVWFADGAEDLPYVEIADWAEMLTFINREYAGDSGYALQIRYDGDTVTLERENGYTMELDFGNDTLYFLDYNAFTHSSGESTLIDLVSENGIDEGGNAQLIQRVRELSFERYGDELQADLGAYGIHMIHQDGKYYVPLQTLNDFTLQRSGVFLTFNGEALFLAADKYFYDSANEDYTEIARTYYDCPTGDRSEALAEYGYNELCLVMDLFYGLKDTHGIDAFDQLFWQVGYDEALSGASALDADNALKSFIDQYLDDLHSSFLEYSPLAGGNAIGPGNGMSNREYRRNCDLYKKARAEAYPDGWYSYEEVGNTAYITFDTFDSNYYGRDFYEAAEKGEMLKDTIGLIIDAHARITREDSPVENVVLDLSNNVGGDVDAAVFLLGWFLGDALFSVKDMATGALSTAVYRSDVDLNHVYDEKDTLAGKNLYCLISPVSFSCGNLVPAALKASHRVTLLGRTSGGGSCVVQPMTTAWGTLFQMSASLQMSFMKNGSFYNIDQGVEPDVCIDRLSHFYDRQALTDFINGLF